MATPTHERFALAKKGKPPSDLAHPGLLSVLVILALALMFWWASVQHTDAKDGTITGSNADIYEYHLPVREYGFGELRAGRVPQWNPYTHCGMPFLATYQAALFYPGNFPHWFLSPERALSLIFLLHIVLAGGFMYLWMRELGSGRLGALFAATAYMLCPLVNRPLVWPHIVLCHAWIPLIFMFIYRTMVGARWSDAVLLGVVVGCQFLAGYMQGFIYTLYGAFAYVIFLAVASRSGDGHIKRPGALGTVLALAGLTVLPALLTAFQWLPTFRLSALSVRPPGGLTREAILIAGSLDVTTFFAALTNPDSFKWSRSTLYAGEVTLVMAAFGFFQKKRWREVVFFTALAVVATLLALGSNTPLFDLYMHVPTGDWFRLPVRLLILTAFALITLAGLGCDRLLGSMLAEPAKGAGMAGSRVVFILVCAALMFLAPKWGAVYILLLLVGFLLGLYTRSTRAVGMLAIALIAFDLMLHVADPDTYPWIKRNVFPELTEAKEFLRTNVGLDRVHVFHRKNNWKNFLLNANFGMIEKIPDTSGYESLTLQRYAEFCAFVETGGEPSYVIPFVGWRHWSSDNRYPRMLNLMGARLIVEDPGRDLYPEDVPPKKMPDGFRLKKVFSGDINVYENPDALPRAFFTSSIEVIGERRRVLERLAEPSFDYRKAIVLEEQPNLPFEEPRPAEEDAQVEVIVASSEPGLIDIAVDAPRAGFVCLNDVLVPGWRVQVDGVDTKVYRADYLFMAVPVGEGNHTIEARYSAPGLRAGAWTSVVSALVLLLTFAFDVAHRQTRKMAPWDKLKQENGKPAATKKK